MLEREFFETGAIRGHRLRRILEAGFRIEIIERHQGVSQYRLELRPFDRVAVARIAVENLVQY